MPTLLSRYRGCLLAGACGDALGAPVEYWRRSQIIERFGEPGITDYLKAYGRVGAITDDTQMTQFTAEGLLAVEAPQAVRDMNVYRQEGTEALQQAWRLAGTVTPYAKAITALGEGWVAEEALAIAIYCALVADDLRHGVVLAVNHNGDSGSTGAISGNLLGAMHGEEAIPGQWLDKLELREVIAGMGEAL